MLAKWEVYYSERGEKISVKPFDTESEACEYFYDYVLRSASSATPPRKKSLSSKFNNLMKKVLSLLPILLLLALTSPLFG